MLFDFLLFEKMDQRNCIKFCVKNEIKCARTFEVLTVTFAVSTMRKEYENTVIIRLQWCGALWIHTVNKKHYLTQISSETHRIVE